MKKYTVTIRDLILYTCTVEVVAKNKREAIKEAYQLDRSWESDFYKSLKPDIKIKKGA